MRTNGQQRANYEQQAMAEHESGKRNGAWRPTQSQGKQIENFSNNDQHLRGLIAKYRADIEEAEKTCR